MEPAAGGALGLVWLIGCYAMVFGIFGIFFGFRLRSLRTPLAAWQLSKYFERARSCFNPVCGTFSRDKSGAWLVT